MLITKGEVQEIAEITDNDDLIDALIPLAEARFFALTENNFAEPEFRVTSNNIVFDATAKTVTLSGTNFLTEGFTTKRHLIIKGSMFNDGVWGVETVGGSVITLEDPSAKMESENSGRLISLTRSHIPDDVKWVIAMMLGAVIGNPALKGKQSVRLGDYAETLASSGAGSFPKIVQDAIERYKVLRFE